MKKQLFKKCNKCGKEYSYWKNKSDLCKPCRTKDRKFFLKIRILFDKLSPEEKREILDELRKKIKSKSSLPSFLLPKP